MQLSSQKKNRNCGKKSVKSWKVNAFITGKKTGLYAPKGKPQSVLGAPILQPEHPILKKKKKKEKGFFFRRERSPVIFFGGGEKKKKKFVGGFRYF